MFWKKNSLNNDMNLEDLRLVNSMPITCLHMLR